MAPSFDGGEDFIWAGGPDEGLRIEVGLVDEAKDGGLQLGDGSEDAALETPARELGEEALYRIEPGGRGRGEVEGPAGMTSEPIAHIRVLVGGVIVDDGMDRHSFRHAAIDGGEETDELLMAMALHAAPDDLAFQDVERGKQGRGAMPLVVMVIVAPRPFFIGKPG